MAENNCQLYLITPAKLDIKTFGPALAEALDAGPIACVQLRLKDCSDDDIKRATEHLMPIAQQRDVAFLINDRADLAAELGTDGVHIGQDDLAYAQARKLVGPDAIVGVTCHNSRHLAMEAGEQGADYVAFGAFFPSTTKPATYQAEPELLELWSENMTVPAVAIGGVTAENCKVLIDAGADFLAVCSAIWDNPEGPAAGVAKFKNI